jgi:hypothetical protein
MTQSGLRPPTVRSVHPGSSAGSVTHAATTDQTGATMPRRSMAQVAKDIGLFIAAPFVTLVYVSLFPFIGMALLAQAWRQRKRAG